MPKLYYTLAILCLLYSTTSAYKLILPPNNQRRMLDPRDFGSLPKSEWNVKACNGCRITAICEFIAKSCDVANITINTGEKTVVKCPNEGTKFSITSFKNEMDVIIHKSRVLIGATCEVKSTLPNMGIPEPPEPDSSEFGLERRAKHRPTCRCGWTNKSPQRIVNGKHARLHEFPFVARIVTRQTHFGFCGGSIITRRHVLTAAHCTVKYKDHSLAVAVGEHDVTTHLETPVTKFYEVFRVINHEDYNTVTKLHDISILLLTKPIQFNDLIGPVCLPEVKRDLIGHYIKVMGWGLDKDEDKGGKTQSILNQVNLVVINPNICKEKFPVSTNPVTQICTFRNNRDTCTGDSGGPLVWHDRRTNMYKLVGIVSYGNKCASTNPGVNTDVTYYMDWIKKVIRETEPAKLCY